MTFPGLASWITRRAVRAPERIALRTPVGAVTYRVFDARARSFARRLVEEGVGAGDRIAYHGPNDPAALYSLFGARMAGAVWVPVLPTRPSEEIRHVLRDSGATVLVTADPAVASSPGIAVVSPEELDEHEADTWAPAAPVAPGDLALLGYTSGTTGPPKGVMLTEANVLWNAVQMVPALPLSAADVTLGAAPFTRIGGIGVTVLPTLFVGGAVALPADTHGTTLLDTIARERVTVVFANPDLLDRIACAPGWLDADLSRIRAAVVGGGLVPPSLLQTYLDRGVPLRHGYGLTEAAPVVSILEADEVAEHPASVGKPLPFVDVRAVRPDGSMCGPREVGAWQIRGPNVFAGYWGHPSPFTDDGWFPTGDVGAIDEQGFLTFVDRASSVIATGDAFVYPSRIESGLFDVRGVSDVAVVDVDGAVVAAVVPEAEGADATLEAVLAGLRAHAAGAYRTSVCVVGAIPRNAAGKVRRDALRDLVRVSA